MSNTEVSKLYDGFQVLKSVFDPDKNCLRVCVVDGSSGGGGPIEVIIDHTTDSIRLGDGTTLTTVTTINGKSGLDVNIINGPSVNMPLVTNIVYNTANTELSHAFNVSSKKFLIRFRGRARMNLAFIAGSTGTEFITLYPGTVHTEKDLNSNVPIVIYFRANKTGVVEILEWS
jgi:hypothetical protein